MKCAKIMPTFEQLHTLSHWPIKAPKFQSTTIWGLQGTYYSFSGLTSNHQCPKPGLGLVNISRPGQSLIPASDQA